MKKTSGVWILLLFPRFAVSFEDGHFNCTTSLSRSWEPLLNGSCEFEHHTRVLSCCSPNVSSEDLAVAMMLVETPSLCSVRLCDSRVLLSLPGFKFWNKSVSEVVITSNRKLWELNLDTFTGIRGLSVLTLAENGIRVSKGLYNIFRDLKELRSLDLSDNVLSSDSFQNSSQDLLPNLRNLTLDSNPLITISRFMFEPLKGSPVEIVSLINCRLTRIDKDAFEDLKNLSQLKLDENVKLFQVNNMQYWNKPPSLSTLSIQNNGIDSINKDLIIPDLLMKTNITYLDLSGNSLDRITDVTLPTVPRTLIIASCKISSILSGDFRGIRHLDLTSNYLKTIPESILVESLRSLKIGSPSVIKPESDPFIIPFDLSLPSNLQSLHLIHLNFASAILDTLFRSSSTIADLKFDGSNFVTSDTVSSKTFYSIAETLRSLSLKDVSGIEFILDESLQDLRNLEDLNLSGLRNMVITTSTRSSSLKSLYLAESLNYDADLTFLKGFSNLRVLDMSRNCISIKNDSIPEGLRTLIFRENRGTVSLTTDVLALFSRLRTLDLTGNIFKCSEGVSLFYAMTMEKPITVLNFDNGHGYRCQRDDSDKDSLVSFIDYLSHSSKGEDPFTPSYMHLINNDGNQNYGKDGSMILVIAAVAVITTILILTIIKAYSNRWYIKYRLMRQRRLRHRDNQRLEHYGNGRRQFYYDTFVSYDNGSEDWISSKLLPNLEESSLKLCIHDRDFAPGKSISDNIIDCMEKSRNFILVLSRSYFKSPWCKFEYHVAQQILEEEKHLEKDRKSRELILIKQEELPQSLINRSLRVLMSTHTYLEWKENDADGKKKEFWKKLQRSLHSYEKSAQSKTRL